MTRNGYRRVRLGDLIARIEAGVSVRSFDGPAAPGEKGVLKTSALTGGQFESSANKSIRPEELSRAAVSPTAECTLVSRMNTVALVGESAYVDTTYPDLYLPDRIWQVHPDRSVVDPYWLSLTIGGPSVREGLRAAASGTSGSMKNISQESFKRIEVMLPALDEQRRFAAVVRRIDVSIRLVDRLLISKQALMRGLMPDLLTGQRRFREFKASGKWQAVRIGKLLQPAVRPVDWDDSATYRLASIRRRNAGLFAREEKRGADIKTKALFTVHTGDFVISRMQAVHGALATVTPDFDGWQVSGMYLVLKPQQPHRIRTEFLHYVGHLRTMYRNVYLSCHGVHIEKMTFDPKKFLNTEVLVPPTLEEQDKIAQVLKTADREINLLESLRSAYRRQRRVLVQRVLSGDATLTFQKIPESEPAHA